MRKTNKKPAKRSPKKKPSAAAEIQRLKGIIAVQHELIRALRNVNAAMDADRLQSHGAVVEMTFRR